MTLGENRNFIKTLERRRMKFIDYCNCVNNEFVINPIEGRVLDKRGRIRPKKSYLEEIIQLFHKGKNCDLKGTTLNEE